MSEKEYFKVKAITNVDNLNVGDIISTSDFSTLSNSGKFIQLEYVEEKDHVTTYDVRPGMWFIQSTMTGLTLQSTSFTNDEILESFAQTKETYDKINAFFNRLHVYSKRKIDVPVRRMLLWGLPGGGKSSIISRTCKEIVQDKRTAVIIWPTDKIDAGDVKSFIKTFNYTEGVEKVILVIEDLGGIEIDQARMKSDSSLLALLDNQEKTFKIPTFIIATTNHPENFLGSLTNRPGRFSDKIEIKLPTGKQRKELFLFFAHGEAVVQEVLNLVESDKCKEFTPDHLKDVFLRADLYDKKLEDVIMEMVNEITQYKNQFANKNSSIGFMD